MVFDGNMSISRDTKRNRRLRASQADRDRNKPNPNAGNATGASANPLGRAGAPAPEGRRRGLLGFGQRGGQPEERRRGRSAGAGSAGAGSAGNGSAGNGSAGTGAGLGRVAGGQPTNRPRAVDRPASPRKRPSFFQQLLGNRLGNRLGNKSSTAKGSNSANKNAGNAAGNRPGNGAVVLPHRRPDRTGASGQAAGPSAFGQPASGQPSVNPRLDRAGRASRFGRNSDRNSDRSSDRSSDRNFDRNFDRSFDRNNASPAESGSAKVTPLNQARGRQRDRQPDRQQDRFRQRAEAAAAAALEAKRSRPEPHPVWGPILYGVRLLVVGVGIGVIAGTLLSSLDPSLRYNADQAAQSDTAQAGSAQVGDAAGKAAGVPANGLQLTQEMTALKTKLSALAAASPGLTPGVFAVDLDNGSYVDINSNRKFSAASTIKLPLLVSFFLAVDEGKVALDELIAMRPDLIAKEAGEMQTQEPGTKFAALYTATEMIRTSDNTATNMIIDRLGGAAELNQRFLAWGLTQTVLRNPLPDVEGTNTTSPRDLVTLLGRINQGEILSMRSRDRLLSILAGNTINDLLPQGLGEGATIAHKTGNIGTVLGDVGLVDMPSGKRYLIMAIVERPKGDEQAAELIRQISRETYQYLESTANKSETPAPAAPKVDIATTQKKP